MKPTSTSEYIRTFPKDVQTRLRKLRETILKAAPGAEDSFSYQIPAFRLGGKNLVHFAGYERHIGFYPGSAAIAAFRSEMSKYKCAKGSVQFPLDAPVPYGLVRRIVQYRVREMKK